MSAQLGPRGTAPRSAGSASRSLRRLPEPSPPRSLRRLPELAARMGSSHRRPQPADGPDRSPFPIAVARGPSPGLTGGGEERSEDFACDEGRPRTVDDRAPTRRVPRSRQGSRRRLTPAGRDTMCRAAPAACSRSAARRSMAEFVHQGPQGTVSLHSRPDPEARNARGVSGSHVVSVASRGERHWLSRPRPTGIDQPGDRGAGREPDPLAHMCAAHNPKAVAGSSEWTAPRRPAPQPGGQSP